MFPLLVVESSSKILSLALFKSATESDCVLSMPDDVAHSQKLLPLIDSLLQKHKLTHQQITSVGLTHGPGSYTSLRVGAASLLGMAKIRELPVYSVSSLASLCKGLTDDGTIVATYMAGRGRYYAGVYQKTGSSLNNLKPDEVYLEQDVLNLIQQSAPGTYLIGPGMPALKEVGLPSFIQTAEVLPQAMYVAKMILDSGVKPISSHEFSLNYLQPPDFG